MRVLERPSGMPGPAPVAGGPGMANAPGRRNFVYHLVATCLGETDLLSLPGLMAFLFRLSETRPRRGPLRGDAGELIEGRNERQQAKGIDGRQ